jgi:hypothetical protein
MTFVALKEREYVTHIHDLKLTTMMVVALKVHSHLVLGTLGLSLLTSC